MNLPNSVLAQIAQQYANGDTTPIKVNGSNSITSTFVQDAQLSQGQGEDGAPRYTISEESWKHHAQARAILGNLIGPNGEQLTSTDPYNTTVFVGGLSPLISEETLRTFFAPFGDIHYVRLWTFLFLPKSHEMLRSKSQLESTAASCSLYARLTQRGPLRKCKDFPLGVAESG